MLKTGSNSGAGAGFLTSSNIILSELTPHFKVTVWQPNAIKPVVRGI